MGERDRSADRALAERPAAAPGPDAHALPRTAPAATSGCLACGAPLEGVRCDRCGAALEAGGFRVERLLHESDHSRVYLARGPDGAAVALKELIFARAPDAAAIDAFEREAKVLQAIEHPAIPRFVASFQAGEGPGLRLYLAQEFVDGEPLDRVFARERFDEARARAVLLQLLPVLADLHRRGLVHRDLKPANLLLRPDGQLALVDFGSARALEGKVTYRATVSGTFGYLPPETLGGTLDRTADLYGLGATLVNLFSGRPPEALLWAQPRPRLRELLPVSPELAAVLERLTAHQRADRFDDADAVLAALGAQTAAQAAAPAVRQPAPVTAPRPVVQDRGWPLRQLPRLARLGVAAALALAFLAGTSSLLRPAPRALPRAPPKTVPAPEQPKPKQRPLGVLWVAVDGSPAQIELDGVPLPQGGGAPLVRDRGYLRITANGRLLWIGYVVEDGQAHLRFEITGLSVGDRRLHRQESFPVGTGWMQVIRSADGAPVESFAFNFQPPPPVGE